MNMSTKRRIWPNSGRASVRRTATGRGARRARLEAARRPGARGAECASRCYEDGILIRGSGDTLLISPPLIIAEQQIEAVFASIRRALTAID
jgi:adenosylmethionine-8-amino-7-oxononanoate aminotransferase